jgi:hypothetical protein
MRAAGKRTEAIRQEAVNRTIRFGPMEAAVASRHVRQPIFTEQMSTSFAGRTLYTAQGRFSPPSQEPL